VNRKIVLLIPRTPRACSNFTWFTWRIHARVGASKPEQPDHCTDWSVFVSGC